MRLLKRRTGDTSIWALVIIAIVFAGLLASSLGAAGASSLFQSVISPPGPEPTETPVVTAEPTVLTTPTVIIVEPTPFPTAELPPALPTAPGQPTVPPPPGQPTVPPPPTAAVELPTFTPVSVVPIPTIAPQPTSGGPAPLLWIIVGLVMVGLVVVIAISPKKPKEE
jgi:hypothetical protein